MLNVAILQFWSFLDLSSTSKTCSRGPEMAEHNVWQQRGRSTVAFPLACFRVKVFQKLLCFIYFVYLSQFEIK